MADDTSKPAETASALPAKKAAVAAAGDKPQAARAPVKRSAPRVKPAVAKPVRKRAPSAAKPAATAKAAPRKTAAAKPAAAQKAAKPVRAKKAKLVRDSFTMPENEYAAIALLKKRCLGVGLPAKKSEILRAAVAGLARLSDASVATAIRKLEAIKTGRPAKAAR
jgi:hypothetical protein